MQRILTTLLFLLGIAMSTVAGAQEDAAWWQAEWKYRKPITVDTATAGLAGDPGRTAVLVRLHSGNFAFDGMAANGGDLRFIGSDGRTVLNHQIEQFDAGLGMATIWVDVPGVRAGTPQAIWMYYGNENAPAGGNGQLTFDPDYAAVFHFAQAEGAPRDTTAYGNHARNALEAADDGVVGRGARLTGEPMVIPAAPSLAVEEGGELTVSMWVRADQAGPNQALYSRRDGDGSLLAGLDHGYPFVEVNGVRANGPTAVPADTRSHFALTAGNGQVVLYRDGQEAARMEAALPALDVDTLVGGDTAPVAQEPVEGEADAVITPAVAANPFVGVIDELRISRVARPAALIQADVAAQGSDANLLAFGADEQTEGVSHFGFILKAMPVDAWIVVAILAVMLVLSWIIMFAKGRYFGAMARANAAFTTRYKQTAGASVTRLHDAAEAGEVEGEIRASSSLWRLYQTAINELKGRQARGSVTTLSPASIGAIRASMEAEVTRESERMSNRMSWLSTTIEGGPYIGLLGTVIGIMLVFAIAAMAGSVDINSVAPGMAAALLCTAAGLAVAIPALFGYHWLSGRSEAILADMVVFVDEIVARLAEEYDSSAAVTSGHAVRNATSGAGAPVQA